MLNALGCPVTERLVESPQVHCWFHVCFKPALKKSHTESVKYENELEPVKHGLRPTCADVSLDLCYVYKVTSRGRGT